MSHVASPLALRVTFPMVAVALAFFCSPANAQTKEETKEFLLKKMSHTYYGDKEATFYSVEFSGDNIIIQEISKWKDGKHPWTVRTTFALSTLNPNRVECLNLPEDIHPHMIVLNTTDDHYAITTEWRRTEQLVSVSSGKETQKNRCYCVLADERTAIQVQKALVHLIELYGGKGDLFEP